MKKKLFLLYFLLSQFVVMGQSLAVHDSLGLPNNTTATALRYWFDNDKSATILNNIVGVQNIDVSSLLDGLHIIHYQLIDDEGDVAVPYSNIFIKIPEGAYSKDFSLRYWFDNDDIDTKKCKFDDVIQTLDVLNLSVGLHIIHYQVLDKEEKSSYVASRIIVKTNDLASLEDVAASKLIYWFDNQEKTESIEITNGFQFLDVSDLTDGLHTIHYMVVCSDGSITSAFSSLFFRMDYNSETMNVQRMRYWFDDEPSVMQAELTAGLQTLDASHLQDGLHTVHLHLIDDHGGVTPTLSNIFIKIAQGNPSEAKNLRYWFDDEKTSKTTEVLEGTQTIDISNLLSGLHTIHYQIVDEESKDYPPISSFFIKLFENTIDGGDNVISQYMYWINDESNSYIKNKIDNPTALFQLVDLLPIKKAPIRSSLFHFDTTSGEPMIYAKNVFHVRFCDATGYWSNNTSRLFVDYNESQKVDISKELTESTGNEAFETPDSNEIKWYSIDCSYGDSIALCTSQASSIQVFSPSGELIYNTSGSSSVSLNGCHAREDGLYYIAVHDVTGSSDYMSLSYKKIDKYAILEYSPNVISSEGHCVLSFKGNGLEFVKSLKLIGGDISIIVDSLNLFRSKYDLTATLYLDQSIITKKELSLEVFFNNEEKNDSKTITIKDAITLEPIIEGDIIVNVVRENRVGDPYPVKVHIKNTGNLAYVGIPFGLAFDGIEIIDDFYFENFRLLLSEEEYQERDFLAYTDNLLGTGKNGLYIPMVLPYIGPYEELVYTVGIKTKVPHANFNFYAWTIEPWSKTIRHYDKFSGNHAPHRPPRCTPSNLPDIQDLLGNLADFVDAFELPTTPIDITRMNIATGEAIAGIIQSTTRARENAVFEAYGFEPEELGLDENDFRMQFRYCARSPRGILSDFWPLRPEEYASGDCPNVQPTRIDVYIPGDPNDISGYIAESGSYYISKEVINVGYDIEFENDPQISNSSAHHIVIYDTLDSKIFDLHSFEPKTIKISGKEVELDGSYPFVRTVDMRPSINAIAELRGDFDLETGIATWDFISLDPMTMESTNDIMQGILPVNNNGNGLGNVTYTINLRPELEDGVEITNRAGIVFDFNDVILTSTWTNILDTISPISSITSLVLQNDSVFDFHFQGDDNRSGIWKYNLYVQEGLNSPWREAATDIAMDSVYSFNGHERINYGFCVLAIDSAGNVEKKNIHAEAQKIALLIGDSNNDGVVNIIDINSTINYINNYPSATFNVDAADVDYNGSINNEDVDSIANIILNEETNELPFKHESIIEYPTFPVDSLYGHDSFVRQGDTISLNVYIENYNMITSIQFDLQLPENVHILQKENDSYDLYLSESIQYTHIVKGKYKKNGDFRVIVYSPDNKEIPYNSDSIVTINLVIDNVIPGGYYDAILSNIIFGTSDEKRLYPNENTFSIIVNGENHIKPIYNFDTDDGYNITGRKRQKHEKGIKILKKLKLLSK